MNAFSLLLDKYPVVFFHLVSAVAALAIGIVVLARRKGTPSHKAWGRAWAAAMIATAVSSVFVRDYGQPNIAGFTAIHGFTVLTAVMLPKGIWQIRHGNVAGHRRTMRRLYIGACIVAGLFTLLPGRFLGHMLWRSLGVIA